ncbi:MAG: DUF6317 family protein [Streptosporangiaceae bacterium]
MSGGFQVTMSDLQSAAAAFRGEGQAFAAIMPASCPVLPDTGSGACNGSLNAVIDAISLLHLQIAGDITDNGVKLQKAHDRYQHTEESLTTLLHQVSSPSAIS